MRHQQVEAWALDLVDTVKSGLDVEDSRVELKAGFIEPYKVARWIAGHANTVRDESILLGSRAW